MFASYNRWVFEHKKPDSVETLREWIIQESEFQTVAAETLSGVSGRRREGAQTFFGPTKVTGLFNDINADVCKNRHPLWQCDVFTRMDVPSRWGVAKRLSLCYRCLRRDHKGERCT